MSPMQTYRAHFSRFAAAVLAVTASFGIPFGIVYAYTGFVEDAQTRLADAETLRARLASESHSRVDPALSKALAEAHKDEFLRNEPQSVVLAELQSMIRAVAESERSELASARTLTTKAVGSLVYLGLKVEIIGPYDGIQATLIRIDNAKPLLFIERAVLGVFDPGRAMTADSEQPKLRAELDIYGAQPAASGSQTLEAVPGSAQ